MLRRTSLRSCRRRAAPAARSAAAVRAPATQQTQYLANPPRPRKPPPPAWSCRSQLQLSGQQTPQQDPSAVAISAQSAVRRLPRCAQHIPAPSPLAQASVRSLLTLQKERTRTLHVHMGVAASATSRISPPAAGKLARATVTQHFVERQPARVHAHAQPSPTPLSNSHQADLSGAWPSFCRLAAPHHPQLPPHALALALATVGSYAIAHHATVATSTRTNCKHTPARLAPSGLACVCASRCPPHAHADSCARIVPELPP